MTADEGDQEATEADAEEADGEGDGEGEGGDGEGEGGDGDGAEEEQEEAAQQGIDYQRTLNFLSDEFVLLVFMLVILLKSQRVKFFFKNIF